MQQLVPWAIFCMAVFILCLLRPRAGRVFLGIFFIVMAVGINIVLAFRAPAQFVALGAESFVPLYRWVFNNIVAFAPSLIGLVIAIYEITIGLLMLRTGQTAQWGLFGGMIFLIAIMPLGIWTLPNVIMAAAMGYLLVKQYGWSLGRFSGEAQMVD